MWKLKPEQDFFPNPAFGWVFYLALVGLIVFAAWKDLRQLKIPNWLTVAVLVAGVVVNLVRGAWLGATGLGTWRLGAHGAFVGLLDGLLFALSGFALGFALFFVMWVLGMCGGGDVKLFAAVGTWVGPYYVCCLLVGSIFFVGVIVALQLVWSILRHGVRATMRDYTTVGTTKRLGKKAAANEPKRTRKRLGAYALPLALSAMLLLLAAFRGELRLEPPKAPGAAKMQTRVLM
jgi:prepilin peptidase CpaA